MAERRLSSEDERLEDERLSYDTVDTFCPPFAFDARYYFQFGVVSQYRSCLVALEVEALDSRMKGLVAGLRKCRRGARLGVLSSFRMGGLSDVA